MSKGKDLIIVMITPKTPTIQGIIDYKGTKTFAKKQNFAKLLRELK